MLLVMLCLTAPDTSRLGDESYAVREFEQRRFELLGWFGYPAVSAAFRESPDPEVRMRCGQLLADLDAFGMYGRLDVLALLMPWEPMPDPTLVSRDPDLRRRLGEFAREAGCRWWGAHRIGHEGFGCGDVADALRRCRRDVWVRHWGPWFAR